MNDNRPGPSSRLRDILKSAKPDTPAATASPRRRSRAGGTSIADFIVSGSGNIVANQVTVNHSPRPVRPKIVPGDAHITPMQARALKELVESIVDTGGVIKKNPPTYPSVYSALNKKMGVTQYLLIPRERYLDALAFLTTMRGRMLSTKSASKKLGADFRTSALKFIHARCREFPDGVARREAYMARVFGTTSLSELPDADLASLRQHILGWRRR
jgi:hypothetical protein